MYPPKRLHRTAYIYGKGVYLTLCLDASKTSQLSGIVKNKATVDALRGMFYQCHHYARMPSTAFGICGINISGVGSLRCSFNYTGQCEGLEAWNGQTTVRTSTPYLYINKYITDISDLGSSRFLNI